MTLMSSLRARGASQHSAFQTGPAPDGKLNFAGTGSMWIFISCFALFSDCAGLRSGGSRHPPSRGSGGGTLQGEIFTLRMR